MKNRNQMMKYGVVVFSTVAAGAAQAALPTEATAAFTSIQSSVTEILAAIWPIVAAVTGGFVLIGLFKKGAGKVA
ncbi:MAG: major coat protein [Ferribacterium limneticum]